MITVRETVSLDASATEVWSFIGSFGQLHLWHPAVAECQTEQKGATQIRTLTLGDGARIVERLESQDDDARRYTYSILDAGPLPVENYRSTIEVTGSGSAATVTWSSEFEPRGASDADAQAAIAGVYTGGFEAIVNKFGSA